MSIDKQVTKLYNRYISSAKTRNKEFTLTEDQFYQLVTKPCVYCGAKEDLNGIDRINNNIGYIPENCTPCCKSCNMAKFNKTPVQFQAWITKLTNHYKQHEINIQELEGLEALIASYTKEILITAQEICRKDYHITQLLKISSRQLRYLRKKHNIITSV